MIFRQLSCLLIFSIIYYCTASILKDSKSLFKDHFPNFISKQCASKDVFYLFDLAHQKELAHVWFCLLKYNNLEKKPELLALLGKIYTELDIESKSLFNKVDRLLPGGFTREIPSWNILGPFQSGSTEFDGDPLFEFGNVSKILQSSWNSSFVLYSELVKDGRVSWQSVQSGRGGVTSFTPQVNWGDLIQSLQSTGVAEWQAWIVSYIVTSKAYSALLIRCTGLNNVYVNGHLINADLYHRDYFWFPILLSAGIHTLSGHLHGKGGAQFHCLLKQPIAKDNVVLQEPKVLPDLFEGKIFSSYLSILASNLDVKNVVKLKSIDVVNSDLKDLKVQLLESPVNIYSGQYMQIGFEMSGLKSSSKSKCTQNSYAVQLVFLFESGFKKHLTLSLRCRKKTEAFLFSYIDTDGSIQHAGAVHPQSKCNTIPCPVVLALHGTGVSAQSQAESYKHMKNNKYIFGFPNAWLLTPSRHGAHNWEGPGEWSALSALHELALTTSKHTWIKYPADSKSVLFAGHSMGGHGAWQLSVHHPDIAIGVISASGWISKETYGDSNLFYRHDIALSHTDPITKAMQEACTAENDADKHVSNLNGIPVHIRIGSDDKVVHPYFPRKMLRLFKSNNVNVTYFEIKGKEHWWWDTLKENDGGVANDLSIRKFILSAIGEWDNLRAKLPASEQSCDSDVPSDNCEPSHRNTETYISRKSLRYEHVLYNPASVSGMKGLRVLVQYIPLRKTVIDVDFDTDGNLNIQTVNVIRLQLYHCLRRCIQWNHVNHVKIDGIEIMRATKLMKTDREKPLDIFLCKDITSNTWILCENQSVEFESETQRGPTNYGPAARITTRPILIVVGTLDKVKSNKLMTQAVFLSNLFLMQSDLSPSIIKDSDAKDNLKINEFNLIILGGPRENSLTADYVAFIGLNTTDTNVWSLGNCKFSKLDMGFLGLSPHANRYMALLIFGSSSKGFDNIMRLAWPTIPPMARSPFSNRVPDYVLTGPNFRARGSGGFLCSGFWDNKWGYDKASSSCTC